MLAERVDADWSMYAGQKTLAREAGISVRTVQRVLAEFEEMGLISREQRRRGDGYRSSDLVRLNAGWTPISPDTVSPDSESCDNGSGDSLTDLRRQPDRSQATGCQGGEGINPQLEPSVEPSVARTRKARAVDASFFDAWWSVYPLKKAKGAARKAFASALKKVALDELVAGAVRYRDDPARKPDFTAYPATWLNAERWDDEHTNRAPSGMAYATDPTLADASARGGSQWA